MVSLEESVRRSVKELNYQLHRDLSEKDKYKYYDDLDGLIHIINFYELPVTIPDELYGIFDDIDFDNYEYIDQLIFRDIFHNNRDINRKLLELENTVSDINKDNKPGILKETISFNQCSDLVEEFLKDYDYDMYKFFKSLKEKHLIFPTTNSTDYEGMTYQINALKKSYVFVRYDGTINSAITLIHEVTHAYLSSFLYDEDYSELTIREYNNLEEVNSEFMELVFADYLYNKGIMRHDVASFSRSIPIVLGKDLKRYKEVLLSKTSDEVHADEDLLGRYLNNEAYAYGQVLGLDYFYHYLDDPKTTKYNLLSMSLDSSSKPRIALIENYGLSKDSLSNPEPLKEYVKRYK